MARTRNGLLAVALGSALVTLGCSKPAPPPAAQSPVAPAEAPAAESSADPSSADPSPSDAAAQQPEPAAPPSSAADAREVSPGASDAQVPASIRKAAAKLARKEGTVWKVDDAAREELESLGPEGSQQLVLLLRDSSAEVRRGAAYFLLGRFDANNDELAAGFTQLLTDADRTNRSIALAALPRFKPAQKGAAAPQLAKLIELSADDDQQRTTAVRLIGEIGSDAAPRVAQLEQVAADDPSSKVRAAALMAIAQLAPPAEAVAVFQKSLADRDPAVRSMALLRLRALGRDAAPAVDDLGKLLESDDAKTRNSAAEALVRIGSKSLPTLEARLESSAPRVREAALYALGKMGQVARPALPALKKRLSDSDPQVKKLAEAVVARIENPQ
jgi:HEAT repeat protein